MKLKYSVTGVPFIEFDDDNKLVFSPSTASQKGYKWLMFSGMSTTSETLSGGKGKTKKKQVIKITHPVSTMINMDFNNISKSNRSLNVYLSKKNLDGLKRLFEPFIKNGVFSFENVKKLEELINNEKDIICEDDYLEDDPSGYYEDEEDE